MLWSKDCDFATRPEPRATLKSFLVSRWGFISLRGPIPHDSVGSCLDRPSRRLPEWQMQLRLLNIYSSKVGDSPKPFSRKSAGRSSFEQGRLGIVFLLDGPHTG